MSQLDVDEDRAVITLQIGHYSNFIGAHFWNIQEAGFAYPSSIDPTFVPEINHGVLFREGVTGYSRSDGQQTFTPRLVSVDLKGALASLPVYGDLYSDELSSAISLNKSDDTSVWAGEVQVKKEQEKRKTDFLRHLESEDSLLESVRKRQKADRKNVILDDQDKDICEYKEREDNEDPKDQKIGYEQYKKVYDLDNQVNVWSDYMSTRFHPRTNVVVGNYIHGDLRTRPFDIYGLGFNHVDLIEDVEDRIRFFAEEADHLRGFHLLADSNNAFGGASVKVSELLLDEYASKCTLAFPCLSQKDEAFQECFNLQTHNLSQFLNSALTIKGLSESCSLVTPLSLAKDTFPLKNNYRQLPFLKYQPQKPYHTSAILAGAIDTLTLPWRSRRNRVELVEIAQKLGRYGRKLAAIGVSLPFPMGQDEFFVDFLEKIENCNAKKLRFHEEVGLVSLTPGCHNVTKDVQIEALSLRGISASERLKPKRDMRSNKMPPYTGRFATTDSIPNALFSHFEKMKLLDRGILAVPSSLSVTDANLPTGCPFPHIFDRTKISSDGFLLGDNNEDGSVRGVDAVSSLTSWQSSTVGVGMMMKSLAERTSKINLNKLHRFQDAGLENDELIETTESLQSLYECYRPQNCAF